MINFINKLSNKQNYFVVIALWIIFQVVWILVFGIDFQGESDKYITEAELFIRNYGFTQQRLIFYSITILIIVFSNLIKLGLYGAVAIIMLINLAGYLYFYKALKTLFSTNIHVFGILFFLLFFWPYQRWSITLYTEGVFFSLVLVLFSRLTLFRKLSVGFVFTLMGILIVLMLTRPMGILFIFPVLGFIYFHLIGRQKIVFLAVLIIAAILINQVSQIVFTTTKDWSMVQALQSDIVIADKDEIPVNKNIIISKSPNQLYQLFFYITHNFFHFIILAGKRLQAFFFLVRNYYSVAHNAFLLVPVVFMYLIIFFRFNTIRRVLNKPLLIFILLSILFFATAVAMQFDDYHNRFFLTLMPYFVVMASAGLFQKKKITE